MTEDQRTICGFRIFADLKPLSGGEGTVFKAVCEEPRVPGVQVGDIVAIKVMTVQDDDGSRYAKLESRVAELAGLDHPNVVRYYGCLRERGPFNDVHVVVEEFVEGRLLKDLIAESRYGLDADDVVRLAGGIAAALDCVTARGIVHRDVKPANVIVTPEGVPKLIDFGVARRENAGATTVGGNMIGTFDYMAPEFAQSDFRGDVGSDVFSFGVLVHEMLTGRTPYRQTTTNTSCDNFTFLRRWSTASQTESPIHVSRRVAKLVDGLDPLLRRMLSFDRALRPDGFAEITRCLQSVGPRVLAHRGEDGVERSWRLQTVVGRGGFGEVYKAMDAASGELVAVKRLLGNDVGDRFRREARTMSRLGDRCLTRFIDYFRASGGVGDFARGDFIVMEFLPGMPGSSLRDVLRRDPGRGLARSSVLHAFARYAHALGVLHHGGIIHRDIKPANLYFPADDPDRAVVMDLGIARDLKGTVTAYGQLPGTVAYMPPEAILATSDTGDRRNSRGGPEGDIWALGLCLYEALTGRTAFPPLPDGNSAFVEFYRRSESRKRPDFGGIGADEKDLRELLLGMCNLDPSRRIRCAAAVERRLLEINGEEIDESLLAPSDTTGALTVVENAVAVEDAASVIPGGDANTAVTNFVDPALVPLDSDFPDRPHRGWRVIRLLLALAVLALVGWGAFWEWRAGWPHVPKDVAVRLGLVDPPDPMPALLTQKMKEESANLVECYETAVESTDSLDARFSAWVANWVRETRTAGAFGAESNRIAQAAVQRKKSDADAALKQTMRNESDELVTGYVTPSESIDALDAQFSAWLVKWRKEPHAAEAFGMESNRITRAAALRKKSDADAALKQTMKDESDELVTGYVTPSESIDALDARFSAWLVKWRKEPRAAGVFGTESNRIACAAARRKKSDADAQQLELEKKEIELVAALKQAMKDESDKLVTGYVTPSESIDALDARFSAWLVKWRKEPRAAGVFGTESNRIACAAALRRLPVPKPPVPKPPVPKPGTKVVVGDVNLIRREIERLDADWNAYYKEYRRELLKQTTASATGDAYEFSQKMLVRRRDYQRKREELLKKLKAIGGGK